MIRRRRDDGERTGSTRSFLVMGSTCGNLSIGIVPLILFFALLEVTNDDLKAFCAAFGTTGSG
jgi:predicted aconitase